VLPVRLGPRLHCPSPELRGFHQAAKPFLN
jgi:hypothetical protein